MKNIPILAVVFLCQLSLQALGQHVHHHHTPRVYRMSQKEKEDVNYDFRENKKIVAENIKHKDQHEKDRERRREELEKHLNNLNAADAKKKPKNTHHDSFSFYH